MDKGINIAESFNKSFAFSQSSKPCIFMSHKSEDKNFVEQIGKYITDSGLNIYLDKYDEKLARAAKVGDPFTITECIEEGLSYSTHILCIVSDLTVKSWWVPYELGYGKKSLKPIATLKRKGTETIPEYLKISEIIKNINNLNSYIGEIVENHTYIINESTLYKSASYEPHLIKSSSNHPLSKYLEIY